MGPPVRSAVASARNKLFTVPAQNPSHNLPNQGIDMNAATFEEFESTARAAGFDQALVRQWAPDTVLDTHTHPFDADALVVEGEMWLTFEGATRHLLPGDTFNLARELPHAERYGPQGATYWVARRNPR